MSKELPSLTDPAGRTHPLAGEAILIGRATENDIVISSKRVSREHACVRRHGWRLLLEDLGSSNGTFLNGERLHTPAQLRDGDQIKVGDVLFTFHDPEVTFQESPLPELEVDAAAGVVRLDRQLISLADQAEVAYLLSSSKLSTP